MKTTRRRSIAARRNGPSGKRAGAPRKGSAIAFERCELPGRVRSASRPATPPSSSQRRSDSIASTRPSAIVCSFGARRERGERLVDQARVVLVHDHRHAQALLVADHAQRLEAAEVGAEGEHAFAARERLEDRLDAVRLEAEQVEALLQQVDAVEHRRREA